MDLENVLLSEIGQSQKAKNYDFTHTWNVKLKLIHMANSMAVARGKGGGGSSER